MEEMAVQQSPQSEGSGIIEARDPVEMPVQGNMPGVSTNEATQITEIQPAEQTIDDVGNKVTWYWSKDVPGEGDRPEWLPEGKTVADMAKRADGLRKQLSTVKHAPEEYTVNIDPEVAEYFGVEDNDPLLSAFKEQALAADISQDAFNDIINWYFEQQSSQVLEKMDAETARFDDLGIDADATLKQIESWANVNLDKSEAELLSNMSLTADQMMLMKSIISKFAGSQNLPGNMTAPTSHTDEQRDELMKKYMRGEIRDPRVLERAYGVNWGQ